MASEDPALAPLELVRQFVNTLDVETGEDALATGAQAGDVLVELELVDPGTRVTRVELQRLRDVREAMRALLLQNNGEEIGQAALDALNEASSRVRLGATFGSDGTLTLGPTNAGVDGAIGTLLSVVFHAMADDTWSRLKVCKESTCRWAFYDRSRNRSGQWCVMAVCGNRNKARVHRAKTKQAAG